MLYRNPDSPEPQPLIARLKSAMSAFGRTRRLRLTQIDLMSVSPHLKRDLGLRDATLWDHLNP